MDWHIRAPRFSIFANATPFTVHNATFPKFHYFRMFFAFDQFNTTYCTISRIDQRTNSYILLHNFFDSNVQKSSSYFCRFLTRKSSKKMYSVYTHVKRAPRKIFIRQENEFSIGAPVFPYGASSFRLPHTPVSVFWTGYIGNVFIEYENNINMKRKEKI